MKLLFALLLIGLSGCVAPLAGPCGGGPSDAGHLRYSLDESLASNYTLGDGNVSFLQVADINERPTPTTENVNADLNDEGCAWYNLPHGFYHVTVRIPHNEAGERSFFEENPLKLQNDDHQFELGFHNG